MNQEIELKYRLASKQDFDEFQVFLEPMKTGKIIQLKQENFYFDTPNLRLKKNGISLRLRQQNEQFFLCAKQSIKDKKSINHLSIRMEVDQPIIEEKALLLKEQFLCPLDAFMDLSLNEPRDKTAQKIISKNIIQVSKKYGLQIIGSMINLRTIVPVEINEKNIELEFDHTFYPNQIEIFEMEVEFSSEKQVNFFQKPIEALFRKAHIKTYRSSSKSSRLYRILFGKI